MREHYIKFCTVAAQVLFDGVIDLTLPTDESSEHTHVTFSDFVIKSGFVHNGTFRVCHSSVTLNFAESVVNACYSKT